MTIGALLDSASQSQDYFWRDITSRVRTGEENHPQLFNVMMELQQRGILDANWDLIVDLRHVNMEYRRGCMTTGALLERVHMGRPPPQSKRRSRTPSTAQGTQNPEPDTCQPGDTTESEGGVERSPKRTSAPHTDPPAYDDPSNNASHTIESVTFIILKGPNAQR